MSKPSKALIIVETLLGLAGAAVRAIRTGDEQKVDEILPAQLQTTLARAEAERRAREAFEE